MIFYLAALQTISPTLAEAAALERASRWTYFRRVQFPLLMPTTLFVLINAVINAFRMVDHIIVMTRGGPDNATTLLLFYIYQVGFISGTPPTRRRSRWCCSPCSPSSRASSTAGSSAGLTIDEAARHRPRSDAGTAPLWSRGLPPARAETPGRADPYAPRGIWLALESVGAALLAALWILPLVHAVWAAFHPSEFTTRFEPFAPSPSRTSFVPGRRRLSRAISSTPSCS